MKYKVLLPIIHNGKRYEAGTEVDLPKGAAKHLKEGTLEAAKDEKKEDPKKPDDKKDKKDEKEKK